MARERIFLLPPPPGPTLRPVVATKWAITFQAKEMVSPLTPRHHIGWPQPCYPGVSNAFSRPLSCLLCPHLTVLTPLSLTVIPLTSSTFYLKATEGTEGFYWEKRKMFWGRELIPLWKGGCCWGRESVTFGGQVLVSKKWVLLREEGLLLREGGCYWGTSGEYLEEDGSIWNQSPAGSKVGGFPPGMDSSNSPLSFFLTNLFAHSLFWLWIYFKGKYCSLYFPPCYQ